MIWPKNNLPVQTAHVRIRPFILPGLIEDAPMYRATLELAEPVKTASSFNKSTQIRRQCRRVEVIVEDIHDLIIIGY